MNGRQKNKYVHIQTKLKQDYPPRDSEKNQITLRSRPTIYNNYSSPENLRCMLLTVIKTLLNSK